jgi:O-antigen/teichoic acid export membrane protein
MWPDRAPRRLDAPPPAPPARPRRLRLARAGVDAPAPHRPSLTGDAAWLVTSNVGYSACQWLAVVALAKTAAAASIGHFGLALAVATPVVLITGFALRAYQATDVVCAHPFADYLTLRMAANLVGALVIGGVAAAVLEPAAAAIAIPIGAAKLVEATSETCYGLLQRHDDMRFIGVSRLVRGALGLGALVAVVVLGGTLAAGAWALAGVWTVFLVAVDLPAAQALEPVRRVPPVSRVWTLARESGPLGGVAGIMALSQAFPRYLLQASHGAAAVGYFTALAAVVPALGQLAGAVGHAAAPRLGLAAGVDRARYRRLVVRLLALSAAATLALVAGAAVGGREFLVLAYTKDYAAYRTTLLLLMLAGGLGLANTVADFALIAARRIHLQLVLQLLGLAVTVGVGVVLVPRLGVDGAAAAVVAGSAAIAVSSVAVLLAGGRR